MNNIMVEVSWYEKNITSLIRGKEGKLVMILFVFVLCTCFFCHHLVVFLTVLLIALFPWVYGMLLGRNLSQVLGSMEISLWTCFCSMLLWKVFFFFCFRSSLNLGGNSLFFVCCVSSSCAVFSSSFSVIFLMRTKFASPILSWTRMQKFNLEMMRLIRKSHIIAEIL